MRAVQIFPDRQLPDSKTPQCTFLNVDEAKHEGLVSPVGPCHLVELRHQLVLGLPVDYENDGPASRLQQPDHPVVGLRAKFVDL